ncbi:DedA family protein [Streptomyces sp. 8N706]|uniref:DedA family protein n=1 Tax=Streptomyces sp. 8N706 TaxID=3457416 RepID=UPI003FD5EFF4
MDVLWTYALLALTTVPPLLPNSGLLVAAGVLASRGSLDIALVLFVVAGSALLGDLLMNLSGRRFSGPVQGWMGRNRRRTVLLEWTTARIQRYGVPFVIASRFLPGGRLVAALAAGVVRYPVRRYLIGAGVAEALWATYSVGLGYLGSAAAGEPLYAVALGIGVSVLVAGAGGLVQAATGRTRRSRDRAAAVVVARGGQAPAPPPLGRPDGVSANGEAVGSTCCASACPGK